jgi:ABC-type glycerol-3-phosphate transport system substrate-binding protein
VEEENVTKMGLSRRLFMSLALATALATPAFAQQIELGVLTGPSFSPQAPNPAVAEAYTAIWNKFQAENPDIVLKVEPHAGNTEALQEILTRGSAGRLPDVGIMDTFWIPRLHAGGYLQPMDDVLTDEAKADFLPGVIEATTHDGHLRSIYIYNSWRGIFYRPSAADRLERVHCVRQEGGSLGCAQCHYVASQHVRTHHALSVPAISRHGW